MIGDDDPLVKTSMRIPKSLMKRVKQYALDNDTNITAVTGQALKEFLKKER
jgi:hypothetical protein